MTRPTQLCPACGHQNPTYLSDCERCRTVFPRPQQTAAQMLDAPYQPQTAAQHFDAPYPPPPPQHHQPPPQAPAAPATFHHLVYSGQLVMPAMCVCCAGQATTRVGTNMVATGTRRYAYYAFPHCHRCARHISWSGAPGTGAMRFFGLLFLVGGGLGFAALASTGENPDKGNIGVMIAIGAALGFVAAMIFVHLIGRVIASRKPACTALSSPVKMSNPGGGFQFRFTNPVFEHAFRSTNNGRQPIDLNAMIKRTLGR